MPKSFAWLFFIIIGNVKMEDVPDVFVFVNTNVALQLNAIPLLAS